MRPHWTMPLLLVLAFALSIANPTPAFAADKQRVPKTESKPRHKPDPPSGSTSGSDEDGGSSCLADCLGSFFASLFSSPTPPPPPRVTLAPWAVGDPGVVHTTSEADSVWLWDGPGGADRDRARVGRLPAGTPMVILETHTLPSGAVWLRVRQLDVAEPVGWIPEASFTRPPPVTETPPSAPARRPPTWGVNFALGGGLPGPSDLYQEYDGNFRMEAQYLRYLERNWQSGAGVGWRWGEGVPLVNYAEPGSPLVDEPSESRLSMIDVGIRAGTRHGADTGPQFSWLLGPALYYVHEKAKIRVIDSTNGALVDERTETLGRWAAGGDLRLTFGSLNAKGLEVGILVDGYLMAWTGQQERSLTTDFLPNKIYGFDLAISITYPAP